MTTKSRTKQTETVTGSGNSHFAHLAGEGPVTNDQPNDASQSIARQEADPTILSHDLGDEGLSNEENEKQD